MPTLTPVLQWRNSRADVYYYEVQLSKDSTFNTNPATATAMVYSALIHGGVATPANSYTVPDTAPLENGVKYYWRVRPRVQGDGTPVAWSGVSNFTVQRQVLNRLVFTFPLSGSWEKGDLRFLDSSSALPWRAMYDNLIGVDTQTGQLRPNLASEWTLGADGKSFRVKLRDADFHGGFGPVRSTDVRFGFEQMLLPDSTHLKRPYWLSAVKSVEVTGEKDMTFNLNSGAGLLLHALSDYEGGLEVRSKLSYDVNGAPSLTKPLMGSGPYKFKEGLPGRSLRLERADNNHWTGTPELPEFEWLVVKEASTRLAAQLAGESQLTVLPPDLGKQAAKQGIKSIAGVRPGIGLWASFLCCYLKDPADTSKGYMYPESPLANAKLRQALSKAVNRGELNSAFFDGSAIQMSLAHFRPGVPGYDPTWDSRFQETYGYDPVAAKTLLGQAGVAAPRVDVIVRTVPDVASSHDIMETIAQSWRALGVNIGFEQMDASGIATRAGRFDFKGHVMLTSSQQTPWSSTTYWNSGLVHSGYGYESAKVDALLRQVGEASDSSSQGQLWRQAGDAAYDEFMNIPLFWLPSEVWVNPSVVSGWVYPGDVPGLYTNIVNIKVKK